MTRFSPTRTGRAREALRQAVTYVDAIARDDRLRADLRSAVTHGQEAAKELFTDARASRLPMRLVWDDDLRDSVRALLDDLDHAASRARKKSHTRVKKMLMITGGAGLVAAATPRFRRWVTDAGGAGMGRSSSEYAHSGEPAGVGATG